jgi:hypothetical protein
MKGTGSEPSLSSGNHSLRFRRGTSCGSDVGICGRREQAVISTSCNRDDEDTLDTHEVIAGAVQVSLSNHQHQ